MTKPKEHEYTSHVAYCRAVEERLEAAEKLIEQLHSCLETVCRPVMESYSARHRLMDFEEALTAAKRFRDGGV